MLFKTDVVLTNDDGIDAAGLCALADALKPAIDGTLYVVAPSKGYSGCSQQVTMHSALSVTSLGDHRFAVTGSPADCVRLALMHLAPSCGLVLSGINHGGNLGHDILLSGTVGAARESAMLGVSAIALSQYFQGREEQNDWATSVEKALRALHAIAERGIGDGALWNVNLPHGAHPASETAIRYCAPCTAPLPVAYHHADGHFTYDGSRYHHRLQDPDTDVSACFGGAIAISRLAVGPCTYES